jgi:hypothetical protein
VSINRRDIKAGRIRQSSIARLYHLHISIILPSGYFQPNTLNMHFSATTIISGLALATTSLAYDTISFSTWLCADCGNCSTGSRTLPPNECFTMYNGSLSMKTFDATLPSCQGNVFQSFLVRKRELSACSQPLHRSRLYRYPGGAQIQRRPMRGQDSFELLQDHLLGELPPGITSRWCTAPAPEFGGWSVRGVGTQSLF